MILPRECKTTIFMNVFTLAVPLIFCCEIPVKFELNLIFPNISRTTSKIKCHL